MNARYYDPETCRFINSDNNLDGGLNLFAYCGNNPINMVDYDGEFPNLNPFGLIHDQVVAKISEKYGYHKEQTIGYNKSPVFGNMSTIKWGRADLVSDDGQIWDVKRDKKSKLKQVKSKSKNMLKTHGDLNQIKSFQ